MDMLEMIRIADSTQQVLQLVGEYVQTLVHASAIPDWCARSPLNGVHDIRRRAETMFVVIDAASRQLDHYSCEVAKEALQIFAAAVARLEHRSDRPMASATWTSS